MNQDKVANLYEILNPVHALYVDFVYILVTFFFIIVIIFNSLLFLLHYIHFIIFKFLISTSTVNHLLLDSTLHLRVHSYCTLHPNTELSNVTFLYQKKAKNCKAFLDLFYKLS